MYEFTYDLNLLKEHSNYNLLPRLTSNDSIMLSQRGKLYAVTQRPIDFAYELVSIFEGKSWYTRNN